MVRLALIFCPLQIRMKMKEMTLISSSFLVCASHSTSTGNCGGNLNVHCGGQPIFNP